MNSMMTVRAWYHYLWNRIGVPAGASISADIAVLEARLTAARADYLDELAPAAMPADIDTLIAAVDALPQASPFEQTVPIFMNTTQEITNGGAAATVTFIATNTTGASGLYSIDDAKVDKVFLLIIGRAVNVFDGANEIDGTTATDNQWQIDMDGGGWLDVQNEDDDGVLVDHDWRCPTEGAIHPFTFIFNVTGQIDNIDGKIGLRLENSLTLQDSLWVTLDVYLKIVWLP